MDLEHETDHDRMEMKTDPDCLYIRCCTGGSAGLLYEEPTEDSS